MPRILYLTTELPYFPGQGGMMALHVDHLAKTHLIGVVGPRYPHQPESALQKLRDIAQKTYWWPEHPAPGALPAVKQAPIPKRTWLRQLPEGLKIWTWRRLSGLGNFSDDAIAWRMAMVNLAPKLLEALDDHRWNVVLLSQSTSSPWFRFLPATLARCVLFHDIRSDYLQRAPQPLRRSQLQGIETEEILACQGSNALLFVSGLDEKRAQTLLRPTVPTAVAPICLDLEYFDFRPTQVTEAVVLFTGHLSHLPNVDALLHFLQNIWSAVLAARPQAKFRVVGLQPAQEVVTAMQQARNVELIANAPDIRPYFRQASVYVVPMRYGGGVRQKILEAWAMGVPVVTTSMGAEGILAESGINCWMADDPRHFADQVVSLLDQPAPPALLGSARALVESDHSQENSSPSVARQLTTAIQARRAQPPRVLYDLRWLVPGKVGGVEQMTRELIDEISSFDHGIDYRFYGPATLFRKWRFPAGFRHKVVSPDDTRSRWTAWRDGLAQSLADDLKSPPMTSPALRALEWYARLDFTVVHGLPCLVHPDLRRFPSVVTMHDLQHLHLPEYFKPEDISTREREYRESCRRADHIICTSEFTRQDVHRQYQVPLDKMSTIWNLPPHATSQRPDTRLLRRSLAQLGINYRYLLYPAQPWLHKNHAGLLRAIQLIDDILPTDIRLVLTGQPFPPGHPAAELMLDPKISKRVVHLGYRTPTEIVTLYGGAEAMVFPSLFEGFGMPVIEAMQQQCPVVCGHHTSLPEIAGDAALLVDCTTPDALAEGILRVIRDEPLAHALRERGRENLRRFNRRELAENTRLIYRRIHEAHFS